MLNLIHIAHSTNHDVFAINPTNGRRTFSGSDSRDVTLNLMAMTGKNNVFTTQHDVEIVPIEHVFSVEEIEDIFAILN